MKKIVISIVGIGFICLSGCVSACYVSPTGEKINYSRLGFQSLTNLEMEKQADGSINMKFDKQEGGENIGTIIGSAVSTAIKGITTKGVE